MVRVAFREWWFHFLLGAAALCNAGMPDLGMASQSQCSFILSGSGTLRPTNLQKQRLSDPYSLSLFESFGHTTQGRGGWPWEMQEPDRDIQTTVSLYLGQGRIKDESHHPNCAQVLKKTWNSMSGSVATSSESPINSQRTGKMPNISLSTSSSKWWSSRSWTRYRAQKAHSSGQVGISSIYWTSHVICHSFILSVFHCLLGGQNRWWFLRLWNVYSSWRRQTVNNQHSILSIKSHRMPGDETWYKNRAGSEGLVYWMWQDSGVVRVGHTHSRAGMGARTWRCSGAGQGDSWEVSVLGREKTCAESLSLDSAWLVWGTAVMPVWQKRT